MPLLYLRVLGKLFYSHMVVCTHKRLSLHSRLVSAIDGCLLANGEVLDNGRSKTWHNHARPLVQAVPDIFASFAPDCQQKRRTYAIDAGRSCRSGELKKSANSAESGFQGHGAIVSFFGKRAVVLAWWVLALQYVFCYQLAWLLGWKMSRHMQNWQR